MFGIKTPANRVNKTNAHRRLEVLGKQAGILVKYTNPTRVDLHDGLYGTTLQ